MAALTYEAISHWGYLTVGVLTNWKVKVPPPQRMITHPDRAEPEPPKPEKASKQQILKFFGQLKGG